ncbi:hypothetical protein BDV59DRAFT_185519 [Aspergillus ambiguus]|uniref:uncharacterized protein n=1 Tax=Aspergillus ambiguus TaxID=176160 RepID=UPI003CCE3E56
MVSLWPNPVRPIPSLIEKPTPHANKRLRGPLLNPPTEVALHPPRKGMGIYVYQILPSIELTN